jgi:hypothetical protein
MNTSTQTPIANVESHPESITFSGSMRAGAFTAQLGVKLAATPTALTLSTMGRSFRLDREHFASLEDTSILGIFKRGIRFRHAQPGLPNVLIFFPSINREVFRQKLHEFGWS